MTRVFKNKDRDNKVNIVNNWINDICIWPRMHNKSIDFVNALIAVIMVFVTLREVSKIISYSTVEFFYDIYKSCIASIIMGIIVCYLNSRLIEINIENMLLRLAIAMGAGIFIYACLAFLLKIESILEIKSILKTRRK